MISVENLEQLPVLKIGSKERNYGWNNSVFKFGNTLLAILVLFKGLSIICCPAHPDQQIVQVTKSTLNKRFWFLDKVLKTLITLWSCALEKLPVQNIVIEGIPDILIGQLWLVEMPCYVLFIQLVLAFMK